MSKSQTFSTELCLAFVILWFFLFCAKRCIDIKQTYFYKHEGITLIIEMVAVVTISLLFVCEADIGLFSEHFDFIGKRSGKSHGHIAGGGIFLGGSGTPNSDDELSGFSFVGLTKEDIKNIQVDDEGIELTTLFGLSEENHLNVTTALIFLGNLSCFFVGLTNWLGMFGLFHSIWSKIRDSINNNNKDLLKQHNNKKYEKSAASIVSGRKSGKGGKSGKQMRGANGGSKAIAKSVIRRKELISNEYGHADLVMEDIKSPSQAAMNEDINHISETRVLLSSDYNDYDDNDNDNDSGSGSGGSGKLGMGRLYSPKKRESESEIECERERSVLVDMAGTEHERGDDSPTPSIGLSHTDSSPTHSDSSVTGSGSHSGSSNGNGARARNGSNKYTVVFRFVTRGTMPMLVNQTLEKNWEIIRPYLVLNYLNILIEVVTDNIVPLNKHLSKDKLFQMHYKEVLVPPKDKWQCNNGTLFKARALHYASVSSTTSEIGASHGVHNTGSGYFIPDDAYIVHFDEESVMTQSSINNIIKFIIRKVDDHRNKCNNFSYSSNKDASKEGVVGQGMIIYENEEWSLESYVCHFMDSYRMSDDRSRYKLQFTLLNKICFGIKGSYILIPNWIEINNDMNIDTLCGYYGSVAEDLYYSMNLESVSNANVTFEWINGIVIEQSPFTFNDFIKQRKRWYVGRFYCISKNPATRWLYKFWLGIDIFGFTMNTIFVALFWINNLYLVDFDIDIFGKKEELLKYIVLNGLHTNDHFLHTLLDSGIFILLNKFTYIIQHIFALYLILGLTFAVHKSYLEKILLIVLAPFIWPIAVLFDCIPIILSIYDLIVKRNEKIKFVVINKESTKLINNSS